MGIEKPISIIKVDDRQALRISAAENVLRDDLSEIKWIETSVMMVDMKRIEDEEYAAMGEQPAERLRFLLRKLDTAKRNQNRGYDGNEEIKNTSNKFIGRLQEILVNLPNLLESQSFLYNDLPILMDTSQEVRGFRIDIV
jgi:hypothetical protein